MPLALAALVMTGASTEIVRVREAEPVPPPFVALKVTVEVPATVGVPEMAPVEELSVKPAGKPVAA